MEAAKLLFLHKSSWLLAFRTQMAHAFVILLLILHWVGTVRASYSLLSPKGVNYEVAALMGLKSKMGDEYHVLDGWDINSVDPCTWNMVGCSPEGFVISLEMASSRLLGELSLSIGNLSHLQTMLLQNNQLSGPIPAEIGKLSGLQKLDLSGNQFVGEIPSSLGYLTSLSYLRLSRNKLSGQIPGLVANLTGLSFLDLSFNNLSGPTPKILAKDYSIKGNSFLCSASSTGPCMSVPTLNDTSSFGKVRSHHHWVPSVVIGASCTFVVSVMLVVCWVHWCRYHRLHTSYVQQDYEFDIGHLKRFSLRELQTATGNFSFKNILGQGGFGVVYKGYLSNKTLVAVKRLKDPNFTGEMQFQTEVEMIGLALHRNLLRLYGFCMTPDERLLVYPYMPNGSVADRLRDTGREKPSLDWKRRMCIALGAGRQKSLDAGNGQVQKGTILDRVRILYEEKRLEVLVDRDLKGGFDAEELEKVTQVALLCTQSSPNLRPKMSEVLRVLEDIVGCPGHAEESRVGANTPEGRTLSFSRNFGDVHEESSFIIEAMELSGPR
ncbi:unnamed protein product [Ilex paraguariensis]|uniref:Protein kinase domain-containing protein n=1 Tax=Ilex paraguariensis TaxID=185542 RepID=A0ABC8S5Y1_9AQUA